MTNRICVVDVFAGPGGLGEGFSSYTDERSANPFRVALSIEKDSVAHETLTLRAFYRQFGERSVPEQYYEFLRGEITRDALFRAFPKEAERAQAESWKAELGVTPQQDVRDRVARSIPSKAPWVLIGGPPCQAYSLVGRSRNKGIDEYNAERDVRQKLYVEYLQILADHRPAVFVMENVKGLLSATLAAGRLFQRIADDLSEPQRALRREGRSVEGSRTPLRYQLYPLAINDPLKPDVPEAHLVLAERHGVPQARHRVILLGVREDVDADSPKHLQHVPRIPTKSVLSGLPRLRSGLKVDSDDEWLNVLRSAERKRWFDSIRSNGSADVAERIRHILGTLAVPKKGRGDEFIEYDSSVSYQQDWFLDGRIRGVCNHRTRTHMPSDLHRYLFVSSFGQVRGRSPQLKDFPKDLLPRHLSVQQALKGGYFGDRFRVQLAGKPATTITSHLSKDGHYYIHPDPTQCRSITVREAARLQTFPDNYFFCGGRTPQFVQVGNAVPPLLARQIAGIVYDLIG